MLLFGQEGIPPKGASTRRSHVSRDGPHIPTTVFTWLQAGGAVRRPRPASDTADTITDAAAIREKVANATRLGCSFVNQYIDIGLGGIAAVLSDRHGHCVGAISMTFQLQRYPEESAIARLLPPLQDIVKVLREVI